MKTIGRVDIPQKAFMTVLEPEEWAPVGPVSDWSVSDEVKVGRVIDATLAQAGILKSLLAKVLGLC